MKYALFTILLAVIACQSTGQTEDPATVELKLTDLDGNPISLHDYKGKTVFLNLWATWCAPCIKEMPSIEAAKHQLDDVVFLLASDEEISKIKKFKERQDYSFNYIRLETGHAELGVYSLPTTFIFDENGKLAFRESGSRDWSSEESIKLIRNIKAQ